MNNCRLWLSVQSQKVHENKWAHIKSNTVTFSLEIGIHYNELIT